MLEIIYVLHMYITSVLPARLLPALWGMRYHGGTLMSSSECTLPLHLFCVVYVYCHCSALEAPQSLRDMLSCDVVWSGSLSAIRNQATGLVGCRYGRQEGGMGRKRGLQKGQSNKREG
jgi:hypothetical protein